jgi:16S rRNA (guanine(966)-N(2))-methyltransferase RsmD
MRIIAGEARGRRLRSVPGDRIRPTSDRVREALFSILGQRVGGGGFIDLYAGSGAVGLEALSRGAPGATFVENDASALGALRWNLERCGFQDRARVIRTEVAVAIRSRRLSLGECGTLFLDPPYDSNEGERALRLIARELSGVTEGPWIVLEHAVRRQAPDGLEAISLFRSVTYGDTSLSFYELVAPL